METARLRAVKGFPLDFTPGAIDDDQFAGLHLQCELSCEMLRSMPGRESLRLHAESMMNIPPILVRTDDESFFPGPGSLGGCHARWLLAHARGWLTIAMLTNRSTGYPSEERLISRLSIANDPGENSQDITRMTPRCGSPGGALAAAYLS